MQAEHLNDIRYEEEQHRKEMEFRQTQIDEQEKDYQALVKRNSETISEIVADRDAEIDQI